MKDRVCTSCGYVGKPIKQCYESFLVDLMAWMVFGGLALILGLFPLLLIPAAWTAYHIARFGNSKCPKCESLDMVGMESGKGKAALDTFADTDHLKAAR